MLLDAVILAGSPNTGTLRECSDETYEAAIRLGHKPMIRYVVDALLQSGEIDRIAVTGPPQLKDEFPEEQVVMAQVEGTVIGNTISALSLVDNTKHVLIATCDIPLLTPCAVKDLIEACRRETADFYYPIVPMPEVDRCFPGIKRTAVKLREGTFTGGNLFIVNPGMLIKNAAKAQEFVNYRKSPLKLSKLLGFSFVFKLLLNRLSIPELEKKISDMMGLTAKAVITMFPEIGVDLDKPSDYQVISKFLDR